MASNLKYEYYVVQMTGPPYNNKYVIVPKSWIKLADLEDSDDVVLKYPGTPPAGLERLVQDKEECLKEWVIFSGHAEFGCNSYEEVKEYISNMTASDFEEPLVKRKKTGDQKSEYEIREKPTEETEINRIKHIEPTNIQKSPVSESGTVKETTQHLQKEISSDFFVNTLNTDLINKTTNHKNDIFTIALPLLSNQIILKKVLSEEYIALVNNMYVELKESCDTLGLLYQAYIEKCSIAKKLMDLITSYKKQNNCTPKHFDKTVTGGEDKKQTQQKEDCIDCMKNKTEEKLNDKQNISKVTEKQQHQKQTVNKITEVEKEIVQTDELNIINDTKCNERLEKTQNKNIFMPLGNDKNNSRWTLRYDSMKEGLVELKKHTGIYVNIAKLKYFRIKFHKDARALTRNLALEVFSDDALEICSLRGERGKHKPQRPVLDAAALKAIISYVYELTGECYTSKAKLENTILHEMRSIRLFSELLT